MRLRKLLGELDKHPFINNIAVLISGNVLGYCIQLITLPLISRVYSPDDIGAYDLILSSGKFIMDFISLGFLIAIMLPEEDEKARQLCQMIAFLNIGFLALFFAVLFAARDKFRLFHVPMPYGMALFLMCIYILFYNMQSLYYSYTNRCKQYKVLFWNPLLLSCVNTLVSLLLGIAGFGVAGYLIGTISSYIACCIHMQLHVHPFGTKPSVRAWKGLILRYKDIPLVQLPANIISQVSNEIPTQYLGRVFGNALLGGYSMAIRILNVPVSVLSVPINKVVYQTMADKRNKNEPVGDFLFNLLDKSIKIAIIPIGVLVIFGEKLVPLILGSDWADAGHYMSILGIMYLLRFCSSCISGTFVIMERQRLSLIMAMINFLKLGASFGISFILHLDVIRTIIIYSFFECFYQLLNLILCVYCTGYSMRKFFVFAGKYIIGGNAVIYLIYFALKGFLKWA